MTDASDTLSALNGDMSTSLDKATKPKASGAGGYLADVNAAASKQREGAQQQLADTKAESARYDKEVSALGPPPALHAEKWTQTPPENDPVKSFGSWASAVGVLGSLLTRRPLSSALNASAAAMNAQRSNDLAAYKEARDAWKENTELAMKQSEYELRVYDGIYKRAGLSHNEKMAEISAAAAANKDEAMSYMLQAKGVEGYQELMQSRQNTAKTAQEMSHNASVYADETLQRMETKAAVQQYVEGKAQEWMAAHPGVKPNPNDPQVKQQMLAWAKEGQRLEESKDAKAKSTGSQLPTMSTVEAQAAQALIAQGKSPIDAIKEVKAAGQSTPRSPMAMMLQKWHEEHPNATADDEVGVYAEMGERAKAYRDFGTGTQGNQVRAFSTAVSHLGTLSEAKAALDSGDLPKANAMIQSISSELGHPEVKTYDAIKQLVGDEVFKGIVPGQGSVYEREEVGKSFEAADSPEAYKGVVKGLSGLMGGQLTELERQYKRTTKMKDGFEGADFLSDDAKAAFREYKKNHEGKGGKTFDPTGLTSATGPNGAKIYKTPNGWVNENGDPYK
jgi:hypothetical protein